uniref:Protein kinase domain-containing protein n=1 Tax=Spongospora subterranea TaxID=70186 RepID=A0A0H5QHK7_9EUKA|eukprot:CRZ01463.1 hypothetical protein [Spongospora subterranea]
MERYHRHHHRSRRHRRSLDRSHEDHLNTGQFSRFRHESEYKGRRHRRRRRSKTSSSESQEDKKGLIDFRKGEKIDNRYEIVCVAGQGTFGTVLECLDHEHGMERVAVKAVRSVERYLDAASIEIEILQFLSAKDTHNKSLCVRLLSWFSARHHHREHVFLVFEYLGRDLYTFMKRNGHHGFSLDHVRSFARQLLQAVQFCHSVKLCHTDLKPENVLLCSSDYTVCQVSSRRIPVSTDIRLIDFGGATFENERHSRTIATRQYRAPEVILGLPWSYPSDIWSLGCIFVELLTGELLFNTHEDLEHLALMEHVLQQPFSTSLVSRALEPYRNEAGGGVSKDNKPRSRRSRRSSESRAIDLFSVSQKRLRWPENASSPSSVNHVKSYPALGELVPDPLFCDLVSKMLRFERDERLTALEALNHPFFLSSEEEAVEDKI